MCVDFSSSESDSCCWVGLWWTSITYFALRRGMEAAPPTSVGDAYGVLAPPDDDDKLRPVRILAKQHEGKQRSV